jgi:nitrite reductase (NADH) small subunit
MRIPAGKLAGFAVGTSRLVTVGRKDVAVFRTDEGFFAIDDCCPHAGAPLSGGHVENGVVTCPWHAWRFRLSDGAWADNPKIRTGCYAVVQEGDELYVDVPVDAP